MTWIIIVSTVLTLLSGAGAVYASNGALPGEFLYPVKTWAEDVQLLLAPDDVDAELSGIFASRRLVELLALLEAGGELELDALPGDYQNRTELMTQALEKVRAQDPEKAVRLRAELETRLREQARIIVNLLDEGSDEMDLPLQVQLQTMLETNLKTRLRVNGEASVDEPVEDTIIETTVEDDMNAAEEDLEDVNTKQDQNENQNRNRIEIQSDELLDNDSLVFHFKFSGSLPDGVFAEVDGTVYNCIVDDVLVNCDLTGSSGKGNLKLYDLKTNELLFAFDYEHEYEHLWLGAKESGNDNQQQGESDSGEGDHDSGRSGGNK